ncbi:AAEL000200-PA [Aedes aegypti]|uniref:AAEL000200-PA n=2 Tax=Aedes aegypti TaxID=7159 RepID=A0A1S4EV67_AEDAE|nr:uncharacterized protein LOC5570040 [Aedes aegypti]EAT48822.1 AAEL000200-PA [Aedes aegypti]
MKAFAVSLALCCLIAVAFAGQSILLNATHPDHPGKCYDPTSKLVLDPDEEKSIPGACTEAYCSRDYSLTFTSCVLSIVADPNCEKIKQDLTKDYPECCHKYKCVHDGKVSYH